LSAAARRAKAEAIPTRGELAAEIGPHLCTGGACRPLLHDRHLSAASSFQMGVLRGRRIASSATLACLTATALDLKPTISAIETLPDGRRRPPWPLPDAALKGCRSSPVVPTKKTRSPRDDGLG
jgi:hypothetical protein